MTHRAHSPEELELLLEDAFVLGDLDAITELFEDGGLLAASAASREARGDAEIRRAAIDLMTGTHSYLAQPRRILQARDTALIVGRPAINVVRRARDGCWRFSIALLDADRSPTKEAR